MNDEAKEQIKGIPTAGGVCYHAQAHREGIFESPKDREGFGLFPLLDPPLRGFSFAGILPFFPPLFSPSDPFPGSS
jgi:hypothetical protein